MQLDLFTRAEGEAVRGDFATFIRRVFGTVDPGTPYLHNWHIELIADYLEAARRGDINRLIINMPPRSMKSICVSVAWPAFILGHAPEARIMAASYSGSLAQKHSVDTRLVMQSAWYKKLFPKAKITSDQNEKRKFVTTRRGYRLATSVGGTVTGEGGNFLIVDDPLNAIYAMSATGRREANEWFEHSFATRLNDKNKGVIVAVMQRLHEDDLSGFLLKKGGWEHLTIPAMAREDAEYKVASCQLPVAGKKEETPATSNQQLATSFSYFRKAGELLHPAREDAAALARAKRELGSYAFAAQYQQHPLTQEGTMIRREWLRRYDAPPEAATRIIQSWDTGIKAGIKNDASACLTFAEHKGMHYLLDVLTLRAEYPELKRRVVEHAERFGPHLIIIEDKASGASLLQDLPRETKLSVKGYHPTQDKVTRVAQVSAMMEAGKVWLPKNAPWMAELEMELLSFPRSAHDDQVDAMSQYLHWAKSRELHESLRVRGV